MLLSTILCYTIIYVCIYIILLMLISCYKNRINIHIVIKLIEKNVYIIKRMHSYALAVNVQGTKSMNKITDPFTLCASATFP